MYRSIFRIWNSSTGIPSPPLALFIVMLCKAHLTSHSRMSGSRWPWKMMLWKCCTQYASKFGKLSSGHRTGKGQLFFPIPKKGNAKEGSNCRTIALISHASKVMLKILQARLQQYVNRELPDVQAGFRRGRGTRNQIANICWDYGKSKRVPEKHLFLLYWLCQSLWLCGSQ